jgi:hypothetical protein
MIQRTPVARAETIVRYQCILEVLSHRLPIISRCWWLHMSKISHREYPAVLTIERVSPLCYGKDGYNALDAKSPRASSSGAGP